MNKEQREGIARALDTLAIAALITYITAFSGRLAIEIWESIILVTTTSSFFTLSYLLRGE